MAVLKSILTLLVWTTVAHRGWTQNLSPYPFLDTSLDWDTRVNDLVSRLTLEEMQLQMARGGAGEYGGPAPAILRLGIGPYQWDSECLHGDGWTIENATAFPQAIGLSATFSPNLLFRVAEAIGKEVRGKHNDFVKRGIYATHTGASCFSPVINIVRDPRWGRIQETYGEDPFLSGVLSQYYVYGLQGNHSRYVMATAGCKHFDVHGGPENIPVDRLSFDAQVTDHDWRMTFLPAFRKCVQAGTYSLMCSYNRLNGIPACAHKQLLTDILRTEWNFTGYVISDQGAIENMIYYHHSFNNSVDAAAAAVNAGCNLELNNNIAQPVYLSIVDAVKQGKLSEDVVRESVKPLFYTRMRLGEFDSPDDNPYAALDNSVVETPEHQALAIETAEKSFVLLKNRNNLLPLNVGAYKKVSLVGPFSDNYDQLFGDYTAYQDRLYTKTPLQGLQEVYPDLKYGQPCKDLTPCLDYQPDVVSSTVSGADLVIVALGTGMPVEREFIDRPTLDLPGKQKQLVLDVIAHSGNADIVLLLYSAGPLNVTFAEESDRVGAIMECFFPGQGAGDALVNVLTNKGGKSSPAGRLPVTWHKYDWQLPPPENYSMEGRTYRYLKSDPLYPFGYGLSYSTFKYEELALTDLKDPKENLAVTLSLSNTGAVDSDEVIQCYLEWGNKSLPVPQRQLVYFDRVHIPAGQQTKQSFSILWDNWAFWDDGGWTIQAGPMTVHCGGQQPSQVKSAPSNIISMQFVIPGSARIGVL